jgi:hypothetical protein
LLASTVPTSNIYLNGTLPSSKNYLDGAVCKGQQEVSRWYF